MHLRRNGHPIHGSDADRLQHVISRNAEISVHPAAIGLLRPNKKDGCQMATANLDNKTSFKSLILRAH